MKHKGKPANKLVTQNENRTYIKLTKGNCYSFRPYFGREL